MNTVEVVYEIDNDYYSVCAWSVGYLSTLLPNGCE